MRKELKEFFQTSSVYSIGTFAERGIQLLYLPLVTIYLEPALYGGAALGTISAQLFAKLMTPFNTALTRYYYNPDFIAVRPILISSLFLLLLLKVAFVGCIFLLLAPMIANLVASGETQIIQAFNTFSLLVFLQPVEVFLRALLRLQQQAYLFVGVAILRVVSFLITISFLLAVIGLGVVAIPLSMAIGTGIAVCGMLPTFLRSATIRPQFSVCREPLGYGYPLLVSGYSIYALQFADRLILRAFCPLSLVGMYDVSYRVASAINFFVVMPSKQALQPIAMKQENDPDHQKYFMRRTATVYFTFALWAGLGLSLFSKEVLMLFARDQTYWEAWTLIPLIVFAYVQHGLGNFLGLGIIMRKKAFLQSGTLIVTAIVNIGLNVLLIPRFGLEGAAISTLIAYIVWNLQKGYFSWKYYNLSFEYGRLLLLSALWLLFLTPGFYLMNGIAFWPTLVKLALLVFFPLVILCSGFLKADEKQFLREILRQTSYLVGRMASFKR